MHLAIPAIILVTAASTVATMGLDRKTNGTMIPLTKRSPWLKLDNGVDFNALDAHVESVDAKVLRGLENYERNTGRPHSLAKGMELLKSKKRAVGAAALTNARFVWYGTVTIGTPAKSFNVEFDTGSSDFFIPTSTCSGCLGHARWDPASSSTAESKGSAFGIQFGDGARVSGDQYTDKVSIAGLSADVQTIGAATIYSAMGFPPDGMLGMAFLSLSSYPASPFFETLVDEEKVTEPVFSLKLTSDGGELYLGGTNGNLYEGEIIYTPVTIVGYWQVNIKTIGDGHQTKLRDIAAIIDTGANMIVGDSWEVTKLHLSLGGKAIGRGYYTFPCNDFPTISFDFGGGRMFQIPPSILSRGPVRTGSPDCFSSIVGRGNRGVWSLGSVFLRSVYTVFDFGNKQVGFANLV